MMGTRKTWYSVELRDADASILKRHLKQHEIYFEPSSAGNLIHFECYMSIEQCAEVNSFLDNYFKTN